MSQHNPEIYEARLNTDDNEVQSCALRVGSVFFVERAPIGLCPDYVYDAELIPVGQLSVLIKQRRKQAGMRQTDVTAASGVKQTKVSYVEQGAIPSVRVARRLYCALGGRSLHLAVTDMRQTDEPLALSVVGPEDYGRAVGILLREAREERGLIQQELADLTGKSQHHVSEVENAWQNGRPSNAHIANLPPYFESLDFRVDYLGVRDGVLGG